MRENLLSYRGRWAFQSIHAQKVPFVGVPERSKSRELEGKSGEKETLKGFY
jgi:hypothetical protein